MVAIALLLGLIGTLEDEEGASMTGGTSTGVGYTGASDEIAMVGVPIVRGKGREVSGGPGVD